MGKKPPWGTLAGSVEYVILGLCGFKSHSGCRAYLKIKSLRGGGRKPYRLVMDRIGGGGGSS